MSRKAISKKLRFEIFKRDNFTCQYCGRMSPEVILEIDHIKPVKNGGETNILNLVTSCRDCNRGKGKTELTVNKELELQQERLKEINERKEQLEMLVEWKNELDNFEELQVDKIDKLIKKVGSSLSINGRILVKKAINKYGFEEVYESTNICIAQYYAEGTTESLEDVISFIPKVCTVRKIQRDNPNYQKINYLIKIAKNRFKKCNPLFLKEILKNNFQEENFDEVKEIFCTVSTWKSLKEKLYEFYKK